MTPPGILAAFRCPRCSFMRGYPYRAGGVLPLAGWRARLRVMLHMVIRRHRAQD